MAEQKAIVGFPRITVDATERGLYELIEFMASNGALSRPTFEEFSKRTLRAPIWPSRTGSKKASSGKTAAPKAGKPEKRVKPNGGNTAVEKKARKPNSPKGKAKSKAKPADKVSGFIKLAALLPEDERKEIPSSGIKDWEEVKNLSQTFWTGWKGHWLGLTQSPVLRDPDRQLADDERRLLIEEFKAHLESVTLEAGLTEAERKASKAYFPRGLILGDGAPQAPPAPSVAVHNVDRAAGAAGEVEAGKE